MGATNALTVFTLYPDLPHRAKTALLYMALVSLDNASEGRPARIYFGGREALAAALGYDVAEMDERARTSAFAQVKKCLVELTRAGALTRVGEGHNGRRAEYLLHLDLLSQGYQNGAPQENRPGTPMGHQIGTPKGHRDGAPKENRGTTEEPARGGHRLRGPTHLRAVDDDGYAKASAVLMRLDADYSQSLMEVAEAEGIKELTARVIRAAQLAQKEAG